MISEVEGFNLAGAEAIWSMWPGYLDRAEASSRLDQFLVRHDIPMTRIHVSGRTQG